ncbi:copper resistance CopC family protein [Microbacterium sp. No. 7]|uniref:copper resistance CopC family protein n=1 Tax=Microbacterium sp. No. 7 TaxID=1714373 RepID=UPI0006ED0203|nr:copper resistance CopC family protein [Microbacterium sp. No. 7]ALJ19833.1 hypothetical protein AOA12_07900 [Microbacterium sp. No. 7]
MTRTRLRTRVLVAAVASALATLLVAAPASAHDALVSSDPAADARLEAAPSEIVLTYSNDVIDASASVAVVDDAGQDWTAGDPVVAGSTVTVPVDEAMPDGAYEVRWRVASSDGHPIDGLIPFTIGDAVPAPAATSVMPTATATDEAGGTAHDHAQPPAAEEPAADDGVLRTVLIGAAGALVAVAVFVIVVLVRRRGAARDS